MSLMQDMVKKLLTKSPSTGLGQGAIWSEADLNEHMVHLYLEAFKPKELVVLLGSSYSEMIILYGVQIVLTVCFASMSHIGRGRV